MTKLTPITLNLSDGRFLRVGIAFQQALADDHEAPVEPDPDDSEDPYFTEFVLQQVGGGASRTSQMHEEPADEGRG